MLINKNSYNVKLLIFLIVIFVFQCSKHHENEESGHKHEIHVDKKNYKDMHDEKHNHKNHSGEQKDEHKEDIARHEKADEKKLHDHEDDNSFEHRDREDEIKAVISADKKKGIRLLPEALKNINVKEISAKKLKSGKRTFRVPLSSLVYYEDRVALFYNRDNWYNKVDVKIIRKDKSGVLIYCSTITSSDKIIYKGTSLLYLAFLEAFGASGHGHVH